MLSDKLKRRFLRQRRLVANPKVYDFLNVILFRQLINLQKKSSEIQSMFAFLMFWAQKVLGASELADMDLFSISSGAWLCGSAFLRRSDYFGWFVSKDRSKAGREIILAVPLSPNAKFRGVQPAGTCSRARGARFGAGCAMLVTLG